MLHIAASLCILNALGTYAQYTTTPVPILKQIDRHNDDGSYTYGYEAADRSFKIETKYANGEVYGKYGYVDDQGKVREIEYGASKRGFEPAGSDINVPPPTLSQSKSYQLGPNDIDDGQYREDPSVYYKDEKYNRPLAASKFSLNNFQAKPAYNPSPPVPQYNYYNTPAATTPNYRPSYHQSQPYYQSQYHDNAYRLHPAVKNLDIWSGSYSIDYTGRK